MSTDSALSRSRLLPSLLGILLLLMGLAMLAGGIKLSMLGGSLYYLLAGIGIALSGVLLMLPAALHWACTHWCCSPAPCGHCGKSVWTGGNWCRVWRCGLPSVS